MLVTCSVHLVANDLEQATTVLEREKKQELQ